MQTSTLQGFRLSPQQKRIWQLQQAQDVYRVQATVRVTGQLQPEILQRALQGVCDRHEILQTVFRRLPGLAVPVQVVDQKAVFLSKPLDLSHLDQSAQVAQIDTLAQAARQQPFDYEHGPLLQVTWVILSSEESVLLLGLPALCGDRWTLWQLVQDLSQTYAACLKGDTLPDAEWQYAQFAEWQNQLLEAEEDSPGQAYWQQDFSPLTTLSLPTATRRDSNAFAPATLSWTVPPEVIAKLNFLAEQLNATAAAVLLSCWQMLLWRLTGHSDLIIGTQCPGREYDALESMLGLLAKQIPIACSYSADLQVTEAIALTQQTLQAAEQWQDDFAWERDVSASFAPFGFSFAKQPSVFPAGAVSFTVEQSYGCLNRFQVELAFQQSDRTLQATLSYDAACISASAAQRLLEQFQTLLTHVLSHPNTAVGELKLLNLVQRHHLLVELNQTKTEFLPPRCIHHWFEAQVERSPDQIAVVCGDQQITYAELNRRANQLAHVLQHRGVGAEVPVVLYLERSLNVIVGLWGILKAGGAYVPLDPSLPPASLALRLQDAQAPVIVTQQSLMQTLPESHAEVVCLDRDGVAITQKGELLRTAQQPDTNPASEVTASHLIYLIYTSGSTGQPKGVAVEHRQLFNYLHSILERLDLEKSTHFALLSPIAADLGNTILFSCLCTGGCLHLLPSEQVTDPVALSAYFRQHPIDCLKIVPSHLQALLSSPQGASILPRQQLILGGESFSWQLLSEIRQAQPTCEIFNHYGPTETTVGVLTDAVPDSVERQSATVPLGRAIANTELYILDDSLEPVPFGIPGELYIGGANLARGYWNQPDRTAERFIRHPFSSDPTARLYKTGDVVRYLADGSLEFLGRTDQQIKIRGYRVELGEIEACLSQHPALKAIAVVADDQSTQPRIVAYGVPQPGQQPTLSDLVAYLQPRLPDYMLPSAFVPLESLPLTANGKLNRQALPAPEASRPDNRAVAPRTPVEAVMVSLWAQLLGLEQVGVTDNFFALGGHSLLATQLISRLRETFRVELPMRSLFETPTIAGLAVAIEAAIGGGKSLEPAPLQPVPRREPLPLSFAQQRIWFLSQLEPNSPAYNLPAMVRLRGQLHLPALEHSLQAVVRRHEALRTRLISVNGQPVQQIEPTLDVTLSIADLQGVSDPEQRAEVQRLAIALAHTVFDLTKAPLFRLHLLRLGDTDHVLLLTMHHIISDGWSSEVLLQELAAFYRAFVEAKPPVLRPLPIQYADFAVWQRQWLQGEILQTHLNYWKQQLSGDLPVLELPTDHSRPAVQTFRGDHYRFEVARSLTNSLNRLSQQTGTTLFMVLLAAFNTLLYRYTGQTDILVGSPIANRDRAEIEGLLGCFVNTLVLRTDLSGNPRFRELLAQVREVSLAAYAHQSLPFEKLVEELQPDRQLSHAPLFQVMFGLENTPAIALELPDLTLEPLSLNSGTTKFDLSLSCKETESGLVGILEYNCDLFEPDTIARLSGHFQTLLHSIVDNLDACLGELPLLTPSEREQILTEWNQTQVNYPQHTIVQAFEQQVARSPQAIAVEDEQASLTYTELNQKANQLAQVLRQRGVEPEVPVGLYLHRSCDLLVALLGILKAGGAYVPLDPAYPAERLAFMLADSEAPVLITQRSLLPTLPPTDAAVICLEDEAITPKGELLRIAQSPSVNLPPLTHPENLAYTLYTSGSTGRPKGVQIPHRALTHFCHAMQEKLRLTPNDTWLAVTTLSFDIAALELFLPILTGARVVIVSREVATDGQRLAEQLRRSHTTIMQATPATWRLLIESGWHGDPALTILCGGEALPRDLAHQLQSRCDSLWNLYGPTETTIWSTCDRLLPQVGTISIGRPIANTQVYVLDRHLQPVPVGVPGELYLGGAGVARGYLNRPELTAEKFVPNPFGAAPHIRLYRTGDRVRYRPNGTLEFLGRLDDQIKLRGYRIELGEIEATLSQIEAVRAAVVVVQADAPDIQRLVAYLVPHPQQLIPPIAELRHQLRQQLPDYIVPTAFVILDSLPLTPNGKVDRRALPALNATQSLSPEFVPPRSPLEAEVANLWATVLRVPQVGAFDQFFDLGGHSLLATQLIAQVQDQFQVQLPLRSVFESPVLADFAAQIAQAKSALAQPQLNAITRLDRQSYRLQHEDSGDMRGDRQRSEQSDIGGDA
jgi:amino acid adenylation domain-containing protein